MSQFLDGKTLLIAGGASGAGLALASRAVALGATVHLVGRSLAKLHAAQQHLGKRLIGHQADIGSEVEIKGVADKVAGFDHLITTAADLTFAPFLELADTDIDRMLNSKFWGPVYLVRNLVGKLAKTGSITFVGGSAALKASPGASIVAAANAALDGLARTLALELAPVRVNVVSPGVFDGSTWDFLNPKSRVETLSAIGQTLPVGRAGRADEIADALLFLLGNSFVTGTVLQIDGGANA